MLNVIWVKQNQVLMTIQYKQSKDFKQIITLVINVITCMISWKWSHSFSHINLCIYVTNIWNLILDVDVRHLDVRKQCKSNARHVRVPYDISRTAKQTAWNQIFFNNDSCFLSCHSVWMTECKTPAETLMRIINHLLPHYNHVSFTFKCVAHTWLPLTQDYVA